MVAGELQNRQQWPMSEEEYFAFADAQTEGKYEYRQGVVYARVGGTFNHSLITANTGTQLGNKLADSDCAVLSSDMRVRIAALEANRYPDVSVVCGEPAFFEGNTTTMTNPVLLVEVLSPSTSRVDYEEKLQEYTRIPSLRAYLLIAQDRPLVQSFQRNEEAQWVFRSAEGLEAHVEVEALGVTLALADLYRKVRWEAENASDEQA